jgi:hypothetical protein
MELRGDVDDDPSTFSATLTKSGALYFTVTILSTVGFGDITPVTDSARLIVSVHMICDLVVMGILVKLITGVAKRARAQRTSEGSEEHVVLAYVLPPLDARRHGRLALGYRR